MGGGCAEAGEEDSLRGNCQGLLRLCHPDPEVAKRREISKNKALSQSSQIPPTSSRQFMVGPGCPILLQGREEGREAHHRQSKASWVPGGLEGGVPRDVLHPEVPGTGVGTSQDAQRPLSFGFISQLQEDRKAIPAAVKKQKTSLCSARLIG